MLKPMRRGETDYYTYPAAFRRLCVETLTIRCGWPTDGPAAFRRLCVETLCFTKMKKVKSPAAFRRLCVETVNASLSSSFMPQPPSGGCVLKPECSAVSQFADGPAAFRRLCVETLERRDAMLALAPAAFRRLCVETETEI